MRPSDGVGASSSAAQFGSTLARQGVRRIFKNRRSNASWSILNSAKVDALSDHDLKKMHIPFPSKFDRYKRIRRNIYLISTLNGALVNWFYFFQPLALVGFTGVFIVIFSNTVQLNGRREFDTKTATLIRFEMDLKFLGDMILVCIFGIILTYAVPRALTISISESVGNRQRRQQYLNLIQRVLRYDPYADLHEMDYNSNVDPVCAYLWFVYLDFATHLTRELLFSIDPTDGDVTTLHGSDCDCRRDFGDSKLGPLDGLGYDGFLLCTQKVDTVIHVVSGLRKEFPKKKTQGEEDELTENLVEMALNAYSVVLNVTERGFCGSIITCIKRFSIQPPRGQDAYIKNN